VAQKDALNGLLHMRERSEATASGAGRRGCQGNRWIKPRSSLDLEGVGRPLRAGRGALTGAREVRGGLSQSRRMTLSLLTRHSKTLLAKGQYLSSPSQNLNLRPSSIWLPEGENDLRTWPPGCEVACIYGHGKEPAGHLPDAFSGLSDAFFGLADMAISWWRSCPPGRVQGRLLSK
jgi:hypothetical protein